MPAIVIVLVTAVPAVACLWDYDTLRDERRGLPGVPEVLAGRWERHSRFFYEQRVAAMRARLAARPNDWDAIDNLAVALEKLDRRDEAVAVLLDKECRHPGQYTTAANLGTVYIQQGKLDDGIAQLKRALAINPNAHFGRERYQLRLAQMLVTARQDPAVQDDDFLRLRHQWSDAMNAAATRPSDRVDGTEDRFLYGRGRALDDYPDAIDGLVGMVRFGTGTSPDLYFALGDVLAARGDKNLAVRAYRRALELHYPRPEVVRQAMDTVTEALVDKSGLTDAAIAAERAAADRWVADYQQFEDDLIRAGRDVDEEVSYAPFYATHSRTLPPVPWSATAFWYQHQPQVTVYGVVLGVVGVAGARQWWFGHRRRIFQTCAPAAKIG